MRLRLGPVPLAILAFGLAGAVLRAQEGGSTSPEEAAEFTRRAALSALHGPRKLFFEAIDADGILRRLIGPAVFGGLSARQQETLRSTVRDHFAEALAPAAGASSEVRWVSVPSGSETPVLVSMGIHYGSSVLKTRWTVLRTPRGWAIEDIVLTDPGLSLAAEVGRLLGPRPVVRRELSRDVRLKALPRLLGLVAVLAAAWAFARRLPRERRPLLWLTASVPAALFLIDGALAVRRAYQEPYGLVETLPPQRWREFEKVALEEQGQGNVEGARRAWEQAAEAGAPRAAVEYQMGLAARAAGDTAAAKAHFEKALAENPPAPGAGKELALIALAEGNNAEAEARLRAYLEATGPDPDTLATLAVIQSNRGDTAAAVKAIEGARALVGESWRKAELEAEIYSRSGDATAAVAALRPLEGQGRLDRSMLRADPSFLPIATDPTWVAFLNESPAPPPAPAP